MNKIWYLLCCWVVFSQVHGEEQQPSTFHYDGDSPVRLILVTTSGKLVTVAFDHAIEMSSLEKPEVTEFTEYYSLYAHPKGVIEMRDGRIAFTFQMRKFIAVYAVTDDNKLQLQEEIKTEVYYRSIAQGPGDTFIVGKFKDAGSDARIDIIGMDGSVQRTIFADNDIMHSPSDMKRVGDALYVSDYQSDNLFRVDVNTGEAVILLGSEDLYDPKDLDVAEDGSIYLITDGRVCNDEDCVIRVTGAGEWERMEQYASYSGRGEPKALALTSGVIVISWGWWDRGLKSEVASYTVD